MIKFGLSLFSLLLALSSFVRAEVISPAIVSPINGNTYYLLDASTWNSAEKEAVGLGGHLATVRSTREQDWLYQTFGMYGGEKRNLWIGLIYKAFPVNQFVWISGDDHTYARWSPGHPSGSFVDFPFVAMSRPDTHYEGRWFNWKTTANDVTGYPFNGVAEIIKDHVRP